MGLSAEIANRIYKEGFIVALQFSVGPKAELFPLRIDAAEYPNNLYDFSLTTAASLATAGTGWRTIQDSSNRYLLEPENNGVLHQVYYGITPSYARVYRQYPSGVDRGSLVGTRNPGVDAVGYIDGVLSPYRYPSAITETHIVRGQRPAFYGYHPYGAPASITVRMNFYIITYLTCSLYTTLSDNEIRGMVREGKARIVTPGGRTLMQAPGWLRTPPETNL